MLTHVYRATCHYSHQIEYFHLLTLQISQNSTALEQGAFLEVGASNLKPTICKNEKANLISKDVR